MSCVELNIKRFQSERISTVVQTGKIQNMHVVVMIEEPLLIRAQPTSLSIRTGGVDERDVMHVR